MRLLAKAIVDLKSKPENVEKQDFYWMKFVQVRERMYEQFYGVQGAAG